MAVCPVEPRPETDRSHSAGTPAASLDGFERPRWKWASTDLARGALWLVVETATRNRFQGMISLPAGAADPQGPLEPEALFGPVFRPHPET